MGLGAVRSAQGDAVGAAELLSAGGALLRRLGAVLDHTDRREHDRALDAARQLLDEPTWEAAVERGRRLGSTDRPWWELDQGHVGSRGRQRVSTGTPGAAPLGMCPS